MWKTINYFYLLFSYNFFKHWWNGSDNALNLLYIWSSVSVLSAPGIIIKFVCILYDLTLFTVLKTSAALKSSPFILGTPCWYWNFWLAVLGSFGSSSSGWIRHIVFLLSLKLCSHNLSGCHPLDDCYKLLLFQLRYLVFPNE